MATTKKKKVGRPPVKGLDRKISKTVSISENTHKVAIKHFKTLGKAIEFAVLHKDCESL